MENIIEFNNKVEKLMTKHKKLKRKYQSLSADIYVDDNKKTNEKTPSTEYKNKSTSNEEPINE